jgi:hypothetical protein
MSQENIGLYRRCIDAFNRRDRDGLLALMDDEVESVSRLVAIEGSLKGHDGIRRWWKSWFDVWPDYKIEVVEVREESERGREDSNPRLLVLETSVLPAELLPRGRLHSRAGSLR